MITDAMKKIEPLEFAADRYQPTFDLSVRKYRPVYGTNGLDFQIGISGNGFEAIRNLTRDDLTEIRDWINAALAASEKKAAS